MALSMKRRAGIVALVVATASLALADLSQAAAPMAKTQAPDYYRMMLGDFELTALSDGTVDLHVGQLLHGIAPAALKKALARAALDEPVETSVNAYLINTGDRLVLIDAGAGGLYGPTLGKLVANLAAAGYTPEQVDEIYLTHLHPDHVGGLVDRGRAVFPNAIVRADQAEADFWLSEAKLAKATGDDRAMFQGAMASLKPYVDAGRFRPFAGDTLLMPGIRAAAAHGHTAGHSTYVVESGDRMLVLWGDLMHVAAVQFADPAVTIAFDTDRRAAAAARRKAYADAARHGYWVAGAHLSFPGIGQLRTEGKGYAWLPANYGRMR
jgi:glyoxylase-like metal-dependent hydrolase (beta-lactamase superfamily II)